MSLFIKFVWENVDFALGNEPDENDHRLDCDAALDFVLDIRGPKFDVVHVFVSLELNHSVILKKLHESVFTQSRQFQS